MNDFGSLVEKISPTSSGRAARTAHSHGRPGSPGGAQAAAECHGSGGRAANPPRRCRHSVFLGGQLGVLQLPGRQRPRQHVFLDPAQACQELPSGCVQQHVGVGSRAPAVVPTMRSSLPAGERSAAGRGDGSLHHALAFTGPAVPSQTDSLSQAFSRLLHQAEGPASRFAREPYGKSASGAAPGSSPAAGRIPVAQCGAAAGDERARWTPPRTRARIGGCQVMSS